MFVNLSEKASVANRFLAELRDAGIQQDRLRFRRNLERIGEVLAYEISKSFEYETQKVETVLGTAKVELPKGKIVLATVLRAGLPFHQGMLNYFDGADCAFISAFRKHYKGNDAFDIQLDYISAPDLNQATLILCDAMLATGASVNVALEALTRFGTPEKIHVASVIASTAGIEAVKKRHPSARIWTGAVDEELTAKSYIVPGIGDAGDLAFGEKI